MPESKTVRAKFVVSSVIPTGYNGGAHVNMHAVYGADGGEENRAFWKATPAGHLAMTVDNPDAVALFKQGSEYYLDFTPVVAPQSAAMGS